MLSCSCVSKVMGSVNPPNAPTFSNGQFDQLPVSSKSIKTDFAQFILEELQDERNSLFSLKWADYKTEENQEKLKIAIMHFETNFQELEIFQEKDVDYSNILCEVKRDFFPDGSICRYIREFEDKQGYKLQIISFPPYGRAL